MNFVGLATPSLKTSLMTFRGSAAAVPPLMIWPRVFYRL